MNRNDLETLLNAAAKMAGVTTTLTSDRQMWTDPGTAARRDDEGEMQLGRPAKASFVERSGDSVTVTEYGLMNHFFTGIEVVVDPPTRRRAHAKSVLEAIGLTPEQVSTIKALAEQMQTEARAVVERSALEQREAAERTDADQRRERYGKLLNEELLIGSPTWDKDVTLVQLIERQKNPNRLLRELREAFDLPGVDTYKAVRAVRNALAKSAVMGPMSDGANWRPASISDVAQRVGVDTFVATLANHLRKLSQKAAERAATAPASSQPRYTAVEE